MYHSVAHHTARRYCRPLSVPNVHYARNDSLPFDDGPLSLSFFPPDGEPCPAHEDSPRPDRQSGPVSAHLEPLALARTETVGEGCSPIRQWPDRGTIGASRQVCARRAVVKQMSRAQPAARCKQACVSVMDYASRVITLGPSCFRRSSSFFVQICCHRTRPSRYSASLPRRGRREL